MHAGELDRRARTFDGWIPTWLASMLVERGRLPGRVEEAVTLLTGRVTVPVTWGRTATDAGSPWATGPPF